MALAEVQESLHVEEEEDHLPAFTALTNDEDWQEKAEYQPPGTYFVVAIPDSFADVEEYRAPRVDQYEERSNTPPDSCDYSTGDIPNIFVDSETLILGVFEENSRRPASNTDPALTRRSESITSSSPSPKRRAFDYDPEDPNQTPKIMVRRMTDNEPSDFSDSTLTYHYRTFVRQHLVQLHRNPGTSSPQVQDAFEREAATFPPVSLGKVSIA